MIPYIRKEKILAILNDSEIVTIDDLLKRIPETSMSTLRRDLKDLEKDDKVVLLSGGAVKLYSNASDLPVTAKQTMHKKEKEVIAELANSQIYDGDTIYLDSGTTCTALMNLICRRKITIITSNTAVFSLPSLAEAEVIFLGGRVNASISSVNGPLTDNNINQFNFDKAFLGANGIDVAMGVSTPNIVEANKKASVIKRAKEVYLLCDSSKFNKVLMSKAFDVEDCTIISDTYNEALGSKTTMLVP